jgi:hypothetical protein
MNSTKATLLARFDELTPEDAEFDAALTAKWAELNAIVGGTAAMSLAQAAAREPELREEIKTLQAARAGVVDERNMCLRALGGRITADMRAELAD